MSRDFPETWRYNPLRWDTRRGTWINAIPYANDPDLKKLGDFRGVDVGGVAHFTAKSGEDNTITGIPFLEDGVEALSRRDGYAVGIFIKGCQPSLVIIDCDSTTEVVTTGREGGFVTRYGRDELAAIFKRRGETVPYCPAVRGNRDGHGYLIFRQNRHLPVTTRKIKPRGAQFDVLGAGHQVHWTCGNRALVQGAELLTNPPELPYWFAEVTLRPDERRQVPSTGHGLDLHDGAWGTTFLNAVLAPVTPTGGGWNQRLYNAACTLAENGVAFSEVCELVIDRCQPDTELDHRAALESIASAWRKTTGEPVPDE